MTEPPPLANQPNQAAVQPAARQKRWLRFAVLLLLGQITLFYHGCDNKHVIHSLGPAGAWVTIGIDESLPASELIDLSPGWLAVNLLAIVVAVVVAARLSPMWFERLTSRQVLAAAAIATLIFNSALYFLTAWVYLVGHPIGWLAHTFFSGINVSPEVVHGFVARTYYFVGVVAIAGVLRLVQWLLRRYLFIHADRWQVSLGGLLALMAILGTGIGLLLRLAL